MKCICGYGIGITYEPFIRVKGEFSITEKSHDRDCEYTVRVQVYACPKCKTLQMDD